MKLSAIVALLTLCTLVPICTVSAQQAALFDFNSAPIHTGLPLTLTAGGITAHFSATGGGFSIQDYFGNTFIPIGFSGLFICPNGISASDLLIRFDQTLIDFSILYSPEEYGCDSSATMRVTAFMNGSFVGTNTKIAATPGTWPVDTLACSFPQGFDSVVVHFDRHPSSGCTDWGPIFAADNMVVVPLNPVGVTDPAVQQPGTFALSEVYPNPFNPSTTLRFEIRELSFVSLRIFDVLGREVATLVNEKKQPGSYNVKWNAGGNGSGVYLCRMTAGNFSVTRKLLLLR